jgi:hypothetical protein
MNSMTSWQRLALFFAVSAAFILVGAVIFGTQAAVVLSYLTNVIAAPVGAWLLRWIDTGSAAASKTGVQSEPDAVIRSKHQPSSEAATALLVGAACTYALLFTSLAAAVQLNSLDTLEHARLLKFTDLGYEEAQKYIAGLLFAVIGLPAITALCVYLGSTQRLLRYRSFAAGVALSLPIYFLSAINAGLLDAAATIGQPSAALGDTLRPIPGYHGLEDTSRLIQIAALVLLWLAVSLYAWAAAWVGRGVQSALRWVVARFKTKESTTRLQ